MSLTLTMSRPVAVLTAAALAAGVAALTLVSPGGLPPHEARMAALVLVTIGLWASGVIAESVTALIFLTTAVVTGMASPQVVFSGLQSSAFWLIFAGLVIGAALKRSGLGDRIAAVLAGLVCGSYRRALVGAVGFGMVMAFLMPSAMGRVLLILPLLSVFAEHLGQHQGSRGHSGLVLAGCFATLLPSSAILTANVPNNVLAAMVEQQWGLPLAYGDYLLAHYPVLGLLRAGLLTLVLLVRFGGETVRPVSAMPLHRRLTGPELRMALILGAALLLWMTDSWHHVSPGWVGMVAAILCLLPSFGLLPPKALQSLNVEPLIFVGGILGLGAVLAQSGLGEHLGQMVLQGMPLSPGQSAANFALLSALSAAVGLLTTLPGVPAVLTPLTDHLAAAAGVPPAAVLATQVVGFSTLLLPYQAPPLILAMQSAHLPRGEVVRLCLITGVPGIVVLWPLDYLWLSVLGRF